MSRPRVVITGLGVISPIGCNLDLFWNGLIQGESGIRPITQFDASELPCRIAGEVPDFDPEKYMDRKDARRTPRSTQMAVASAVQAVQDSGLPDSMPDPERTSVLYGTGVGGIDRFDIGQQVLRSRGYAKINPFSIPGGIPNLAASQIARQFRALGPNNTVTTACAAGTQAIGEAAEYIRRGVADIVITGGSESIILDFIVGGFCAMRAMPVSYNDRPGLASRPFDKHREGFIISEGSAALIVERMEHALERGARIYGEVAGHASSADGFHIAALDPDGAGPIRSMKWALEDARMSPEEVDYINAHGTSTPLNDSTETLAIKTVFGETAYNIPVSSIKSMVGHSMGASGALEAVATVLTIHHRKIPPTINYETPDPECDLDYVPNIARQHDVQVALSNSFGLGGQNASIVLTRFNGADPNQDDSSAP